MVEKIKSFERRKYISSQKSSYLGSGPYDCKKSVEVYWIIYWHLKCKGCDYIVKSLGFFPTPYPDELFYSVLARYHLYSGNESYKQTTFELFNTYNAAAVIDLNGNLMKIIRKLPVGSTLTAVKIIKEHTLFPFYAQFVPQERAKTVMEHMINSGTGGIHSRLGLVASNIKLPNHLRYCPECVSEDVQTYGETYWRRGHQLPGIIVCHKHHQTLVNSSVQISFLAKREYVAANKHNCSGNQSVSLTETDLIHMRDLAQLSMSVLQSDYKAKDKDFFSKRYIDFLQESGYVTEGGRIYKEGLNKGLKEYYGESFLKLAQSSLDSEDWVVELIRRSKSSKHPLRHLLFINYLERTLNEVMSDNRAYLPFGEGPWPCLNITSDHYRKNTIKKVKVSRCIRTKKTVGTFSCMCGFSYQRYGPDQLLDDIFRAEKVITYGMVWENRLKELSTLNLSLAEIARKLNVSPYTVQKFAHRLNLKVAWKTIDVRRDKMSFGEKQVKYRELCIKYINQHPNFKRSDLGKKYNRAYKWLLNHDRQWLDNLLPAEQPLYVNNADWTQRDEDLLKKIEYMVGKIFEEEGRPKRVSIQEISKRLGKGHHFGYSTIDKLPRVKTYLSGVIESLEDFQIRKLRWAHNFLMEQSSVISRHRLISTAGVAYKPTSRKVINEIDCLLNL